MQSSHIHVFRGVADEKRLGGGVLSSKDYLCNKDFDQYDCFVYIDVSKWNPKCDKCLLIRGCNFASPSMSPRPMNIS